MSRPRTRRACALALLALAGCATSNAQTPTLDKDATVMNQTSAATLARRYLELWNARDLAAVDACVAPDVVGHVNAATIHGSEVLKNRIAALYGAYREPRFNIEDVIAQGDRAVVRWTFQGTHAGVLYGKPATGKRVTVTGMNMFRVERDRIAEIWVSADDLGELEQLGVIAVPSGAGQ